MRVEKFNGEINVRVVKPLKLVLIYMEEADLLDIADPHQLGMVQLLGVPLLQYACDNLVAAWAEVSCRPLSRAPTDP